MPLDKESTTQLDPDWLTFLELEEQIRLTNRVNHIIPLFRSQFNTPVPLSEIEESPPDDSTHVPDIVPTPLSILPPPPLPAPIHSTTKLCRGTCSTHETMQSTRYIDEILLACLDDCNYISQSSQLAYAAELNNEFNTGEVNCSDPR